MKDLRPKAKGWISSWAGARAGHLGRMLKKLVSKAAGESKPEA